MPAKKEICGGPLYVFNNIERVERNREEELAIARASGKRALNRIIFYVFIV